jgi:hypothetical protein
MFGLLTELLAKPHRKCEMWKGDKAPIKTPNLWEFKAITSCKDILDFTYILAGPLIRLFKRIRWFLWAIFYRYTKRYRVWADEDDNIMIRIRNYMHRMFPHFLGIFPYVTAWYILIKHFLDSIEDLRVEDEETYELMPDFVVPAVFGTLGIFR